MLSFIVCTYNPQESHSKCYEKSLFEQRVVHYDVLCGIMLLFMMHIHICYSCRLSDTPILMIPYRALYFFMPYFFYKSGIYHKTNISWKDYCIISAKRLIVPFAIFSIIGYVCFGATTSITTFHYWWWPIRQLFAIGRIDGNSPLWFLFSLFLVRMIFSSARNKRWLQLCYIVIGTIIGYMGNYYAIRPRTISNVSMGLMFYGLGYILRDIQYNKLVGISASVLYLLLYISMALTGWHVVDFSLNITLLGLHPIWLVNSAIACIALNNLLFHYAWRYSIFAWFGRNSMVFLCTHALVFAPLHRYVYPHIQIASWQMLTIDWCAVIIVCSLLVSVFKSKFLCWTMGEKQSC